MKRIVCWIVSDAIFAVAASASKLVFREQHSTMVRKKGRFRPGVALLNTR